MAPQLLADRFLIVQPGMAVDLGTGGLVRLRSVRPSGRSNQETWLRRCAALSEFWHPNVVPLIDYGAIGRRGWFEAWGCPAEAAGWRGRDAATARAVSAAAGFLLSRKVTTGPIEWSAVIDLSGRPALMPTEQTGLPLESVGELERSRWAFDLERMLAPLLAAGPTACRAEDLGGRDETGVEVSSGPLRDFLERVADVLESGVSGRPRDVRLAPPGDVVGRLLPPALARLARLHGYVPVASTLLDAGASGPVPPARFRAAVDRRHVMLLKAGGSTSAWSSGAAFWLSIGMASARPHVLLRLEDPMRTQTGPEASSVREDAADYAAGGVVGSETRGARPLLALLRTGTDHLRAEAIAEAVARGRHARAERLLREMTGHLERRREAAAAGESALALGRLLLVRGQPAEAFRQFDRARRHFEHAGCGPGGVRAAVFAGLAWTDEGRLRESEAALRAARIAASDLPDNSLEQFATLALARCLYWQDRFDEAWECLAASTTSLRPAAGTPSDLLLQDWARLGAATCARERLHGARPPASLEGGLAARWSPGAIGPDVARQCLASRVALALNEVTCAGRLAADARDRAGQSGNPTEVSAACCAKALVYGVLGDMPAVRALVEEGIEAARSAHAPLRAIRLRIVLADALRRAGRTADAGLLVSRLARLDPAKLPRVVAIPLERTIRGDAAGAGTRRGATAHPTGRPPHGALTGAPVVSSPEALDTIVEVLGACQSSEQDAHMLQSVAVLLRERLRAVSVACYGIDSDLPVVLAADGRSARPEDVARRAMDAALPIAPAATASGLEAAVPIRVAGAPVGALACRWAADRPPSWPAAGGILAAAAAAVAPSVRAELDRRRTPSLAAENAPDDLVGVSDAMATLRQEIARAARAPFNVVIEGESGSGKELVARAIHRLGPRRHAPLCALNCAALADELVEAELFGHARGAFTGAMTERKGLFEEADRGILVLDEVAELSARAQAKLLRVIQEGEVRRVGENFTRSVDVRIVAATNRCLRAAAEAGAFRPDLRYRLEVIRIVVPPLRARAEDIPVLAAHFWRQASSRVGSSRTLAPETLAALARYDWPGNVRELQNVMAALAAAGGRGSVGPEHLPTVIAGQRQDCGAETLDEARRRFEARFVRAALARAGGRRVQAAGDLGLTRQGLAKLMARLGIE